jgi:hypothetical protein
VVTLTGALRLRHSTSLQVRVRGTHGHPVRQVQVTLDGRKVGITRLQRGMTDRKGNTVLRPIKPARRGTIIVSARKTGYRTVTLSLSIKR